MSNPRELIRAEIALLRARIKALEDADKTLSRYYPDVEFADSGMVAKTVQVSSSTVQVIPESDELSGKTIHEAARFVLIVANGRHMSAREVAEEAMRRGYRSTNFRNRENDPKKTIASFYATMKRDGYTFSRKGGLFGLMDEPIDISEPSDTRQSTGLPGRFLLTS